MKPDTKPTLQPLDLQYDDEHVQCYIDEDAGITVPALSAYQGLPQGMPSPLFGSAKELGMQHGICYDRINRFGPYGLGFTEEEGGLGIGFDGDKDGLDSVNSTDYRSVNWGAAQERCLEKNPRRKQQRTAIVIRTWHTFNYTPHHIMMLRSMIAELALASGGEYTIHFLIHVQDDEIPIWANKDIYNAVLRDALPAEFAGMGTLWSVAQMRLIYPPPFPDTIVNFSGGDIYSAYRSLHFPLQYWASQHPEFEYVWQWEMDIRVTGHYYELFHRITNWAEKQPGDYAWERYSKFYIPALYSDSYAKYEKSVSAETKKPISGPQLPKSHLLSVPAQPNAASTDDIVDLVTLNPIFNPEKTRWAFEGDITGYLEGRPPTRASLITASRVSHRLLTLMHEETFRNNHTMFAEMWPASVAFHYGLKSVYAPLPIYHDHEWPAEHANEIFNNAKLRDASKAVGMDHGGGYFHGKDGSVFGPGEHVFRGASYYSNAGFAGYLWRRWLGKENENNELDWEMGEGGGRMCLPMMVVHPIKNE